MRATPRFRAAQKCFVTLLSLVLTLTLACFAGATAATAASKAPAPTGLKVTGKTYNSVSLDWGDSRVTTGFRVRWATKTNFSDAKGKGFSTSKATITGLRANTKYYFRVAGTKNRDGSGDPVTYYTAATAVPATTSGFAAPGRVTATSPTKTSLKLSWPTQAGAPGYRLVFSKNSDLTSSSKYFIGGTTGSKTITGLSTGRRYYFAVRAAESLTSFVGPACAKSSAMTGSTTQPVPPEPTATSADIEFGTFNVGTWSGDPATDTDPWHKRWDTRKATVVKQLLGTDPGASGLGTIQVAAIQEASQRKLPNGLPQDKDLLNALNAAAPAGDHFTAAPASKGAERIFYNDKDLSLISSGQVSWSHQENPDIPRYLAWAKLRINASGDPVFVASVHLSSHDATSRASQWQQLLNVVPDLAGGAPILIGGDFNSPRTPGNPTAANFLPKMQAAGIGDSLGQTSSSMLRISQARPKVVRNGNINSLNKWVTPKVSTDKGLGLFNHYPNTDYAGQSIDYIFASNHLAVKRWTMVANHYAYRAQSYLPSDHNLIRTTITIP